ncbi:MAG: ion channel [Archangium sp.]
MAPAPRHRRPSFFSDQRETTVLVGARPLRWRDLYHLLLRSPWWLDVLLLTTLFFLINLLFAVGYMLAGGVANAPAGSFVDAFFFSVQTMGTIGYGAMYPVTLAAHLLVTLQTVTGIFVLALTTGIIFAKFSVPKARVLFSRTAVISPLNGVPTLSFRISNERGNHIVEAQVRVSILRKERTLEGLKLYRMRDLALVRDRSPAFLRTWTVLHPLTPDSPLHGATPESMQEDDTQLLVTLTGIDGTSAQTIHARHAYLNDEVEWGAQHVDILSELDDGRIQLDLSKFHDTVPTVPTDTFPYPRREPP